MSDTTHDRFDHRADRPDEVTDPLLWGLALDVADAHQPDEQGTDCANLLCAGQGWPCAAWQTAQRALQVAQTSPEQGPASPDLAGEPADRWLPSQARRLRPATPELQRHAGAAA